MQKQKIEDFIIKCYKETSNKNNPIRQLGAGHAFIEGSDGDFLEVYEPDEVIKHIKEMQKNPEITKELLETMDIDLSENAEEVGSLLVLFSYYERLLSKTKIVCPDSKLWIKVDMRKQNVNDMHTSYICMQTGEMLGIISSLEKDQQTLSELDDVISKTINKDSTINRFIIKINELSDILLNNSTDIQKYIIYFTL